MNSEKILLKEVSNIQNRFIEQYKKTGEGYNVFKIIRNSNDEVHLHTKILADILNPKSYHMLGLRPLELFFKHCLPGENLNVKNQKFIIRREKPTNYGQIDILIEGKSLTIAIENKLKAEDQPSQLWRYFHYLKTKGHAIKLFYLTYEGRAATDISLMGPQKKDKKLQNGQYFQISYEKNIVGWLSELLEEFNGKPWFFEPIRQYLNIVKEEVGLSMTNEEEKSIHAVIRESGHSYKAALNIATSFNNVKEDIQTEIKEYFKSQMKVIAHEHRNAKYYADNNDNWYVKIGKFSYGIWWDQDYIYYGVKVNNNKEFERLSHVLMHYENYLNLNRTLSVNSGLLWNHDEGIISYLDQKGCLAAIVAELRKIIMKVQEGFNEKHFR